MLLGGKLVHGSECTLSDLPSDIVCRSARPMHAVTVSNGPRENRRRPRPSLVMASGIDDLLNSLKVSKAILRVLHGETFPRGNSDHEANLI